VTYDAREISTHGGEPLELYEFTVGAQVQRWTSAARIVSAGGNDYTPAPLQRSRIEQSVEEARKALTIDCPRDFPVAELYRVVPPSEVILVTVKRLHRGDGDVAAIWMGRVLNCEWQDNDQARLQCEPVSSSLKRPGLRRPYSRNCPHVLYSQGPGMCNVDRATHSTVTTVSAIAGLTLTVAALAEMPWVGGYVEWLPAGAPAQRRFINGRDGLVLTLAQAFQGIPLGAAVTVVPTCDHTMSMCEGTYDNLPHYGGFPFIPLKNPFDGTPVY
jgi:hypothetical protein